MNHLRRRVEKLSPEQRARLADRLGIVADESDPATGVNRLTAYVVARDEIGDTPDPADLRSFLKDRLPDYMVPASIVVLDGLPRTPNGKIDLRRLPRPEERRSHSDYSFVPPRTETEATLAAIWEEVLGGVRVGVHDDFFEIGGDSILSIQVVARAAGAGIRLAPDQLFQHKTIAALATVVGIAPIALPEQGLISGDVPLTPIQHWFFEQPFPRPDHWQQALWIDVPAHLDAELLEEAANQVILHHDALRLRFVPDGERWRQLHAPSDARVRLRRLDVSALPEYQQDGEMLSAADRLAAGTDLGTGPLVSLLLVDRGDARPARMLISIHHLVVDPISWQLLVEDLDTACAQLRTGAPVRLPAKTSSFLEWAATLVDYSVSDRLREERQYWLHLPRVAERIPRDEPGDFTEGSSSTITVELTEDQTDSLLHRVPEAYNTRIDEVLLTALASAIGGWTGSRRTLVGIERHGREAIGDGLDLSRTVGWFTSYSPLWLAMDGSGRPGEALKSIKEQVRRVPGRGLGYGVFRYLSPDADLRKALREMPQPEVVFNYSGRAGLARSSGSGLRPVGLPFSLRDGTNQRAHVLEINARVEHDRLQLGWSFSVNIHHRQTVERLAESYLASLAELITHCTTAGAGGFTPSDFPEAGLDQEALDRFLGNLFS